MIGKLTALKLFLTIPALLACWSVSVAESNTLLPITHPKPVQIKQHTLLTHTSQAVADLIHNVPEQDRIYTVYLTLCGVDPKDVEKWNVVLCWWLHQLSFQRARSKPVPVFGTDGLLLRIDIRDYRWNREAWRVVATRDPYVDESWIRGSDSLLLRDLVDNQVDKKTADKGRYPLYGIVRADWFLRESMESNRSPTYYDLLFARQRYRTEVVKEKKDVYSKQEWRTETITTWHGGGSYVWPDDTGRVSSNVPRGRYTVDLKFKIPKKKISSGETETKKVVFVDFPKNEQDWNIAFGVDKVVEYLKQQEINLYFGAVVPGGDDDPKGSLVARNNRVIQLIEGPLGWFGATYDAEKTAGKKDYLENAGTVALGKIESDGGELLAQLPNGGQAGILVNGKRERVEIAATTLAHAAKMDKRYPDVRTFHSCVVCHGPDSSFIDPRNLVEEIEKAGVATRFKKREDYLAYRAFFFGWKSKIEGFRKPYADLVAYCSTTKQNPKGITPAEMSTMFIELRDKYDAPINPEQAAREMGLELELAKLVWVKSPNKRLNGLVQGLSVPRSTWESDTFKESMLLAELLKGRVSEKP